MEDATLALVLQARSVTEKLDWLGRLAPDDAAAIGRLIDDCLVHRWPTTSAAWHRAAEQFAVKH